MDIKTVLTEVQQTIEPERAELIDIAKTIWANPEIAFTEHKAAKLLTDLLRKYGFKVECPYAGMDTAFRAEFTRGTGGGVFAFAAEYDALVGIGHACGHNMIGVVSVAAAYAAKVYMEKHDLSGTVIVLGTPGEESGGGKVKMLQNSECLKGVDAVMMTHSGGDTTTVDGGCTGIRRFEVVYHGRASHAAGTPEKGINALDAQVLLCNAIGLFRQQMNRAAIIHGVILEGGEAANVIPDHTRSRYYLRSKQEPLIDELEERFRKMVEGAALMTGCTYDINPYSIPYKSRKPNSILNKLFLDGAKALGTMNVSDDIPDGRGSSDFGDFSHAAPGAHPYFAVAPRGTNVPGHSEIKKAVSNSDYGYARMIDAAAVMARCALEVLADPELRKAIRAEFEGK